MGSQPIAADAELRIRAADWQTLTQHLFPGDHDEHGAVLLCGLSTRGRSPRLIVREVVLAADGVDYVPGTRGYRHLTGEFVTHQIRRAKDLGLVYLAVHNHGGRDAVAFSTADLASHERGYPTLVKLSGKPVGGVVCARNALAGDIWHPDGGRRKISHTVVVGTHRHEVTPDRRQAPRADDSRYQRQALLFGAVGQSMLELTRVAVVGCGGIGMLLVQSLARLGVGHLTLVDPDRVDSTNLPRLPEATRRDAMAFLDHTGRPAWIRRLGRRLAQPKVYVARRLARTANPGISVRALNDDVAFDRVATQLLDADFIFLAADTMIARDVVNQVAHQYLIPALQVGSKVVLDPTNGAVVDVFAVVRHVGIEAGCLRCAGVIDPAKLSEEALGDPEQAARQRYIDDPDVHAPSVITLNALGTGFALNDFMLHTVGLGGADPAHRVIRNRAAGINQPHVTVIEVAPNSTCPVCSLDDHSTRGVADQAELPTRIVTPATRPRGLRRSIHTLARRIGWS